MQTYSNTLWLGIWLCLVPFLGLSGIWKERLIILTGLFVLARAALRYYERRKGISASHTPYTASGVASKEA